MITKMIGKWLAKEKQKTEVEKRIEGLRRESIQVGLELDYALLNLQKKFVEHIKNSSLNEK